jgi:hypothetical protein
MIAIAANNADARSPMHHRQIATPGMTFDEALATVPFSKTFFSEISGAERTYHFTEEDRISAAREILAREADAERAARMLIPDREPAVGDRCQDRETGVTVLVLATSAIDPETGELNFDWCPWILCRPEDGGEDYWAIELLLKIVKPWN